MPTATGTSRSCPGQTVVPVTSNANPPPHHHHHHRACPWELDLGCLLPHRLTFVLPPGLGSWGQLVVSSVVVPGGQSGQVVPRKGTGQDGMSHSGPMSGQQQFKAPRPRHCDVIIFPRLFSDANPRGGFGSGQAVWSGVQHQPCLRLSVLCCGVEETVTLTQQRLLELL